MENILDEKIVIWCSATLAGHKCGSLFSCALPADSAGEIAGYYNALLAPKGLALRIIPGCAGRALVYVYRPAALQRRLDDPDIRAFLSEYGYRDFSAGACVSALGEKLKTGGSFPHEIGIFLDYPLADVKAFIRHSSEGYLCAGCWKCYYDIETSLKKFALFKKCSEVYARCYRRGFGLYRLAVNTKRA